MALNCKKGSQDFNVKAPKSSTQVIELIEKHRVEKLSQLLQHGKLDLTRELKWAVHGSKEYVNVLHVAASRPSPDVLRLLLQHGCQVNQLTGSRQTALHIVASHQGSNLDNIDTLVENGIDVNAVDKYGRTALHEAVLHQHLRAVRKLAQLQNIELYKGDIYDKTALDIARESNNVELQRWTDQYKKRFQPAVTNHVHDRHDLTHAERGGLSEARSGEETMREEIRLLREQNNQLTHQMQQQNQQLQQQGHQISNLTYMLHSKLGVDNVHQTNSYSKQDAQSEPFLRHEAQRHPAPSRSLDLDKTESASRHSSSLFTPDPMSIGVPASAHSQQQLILTRCSALPSPTANNNSMERVQPTTQDMPAPPIAKRLSEDNYKCIQRNSEDLLEHMRPAEMEIKLFSNAIIDHREFNKLKSITDERQKNVHILFNIILEGTDEDYVKFVDILRGSDKNSQLLAERLRPRRDE